MPRSLVFLSIWLLPVLLDLPAFGAILRLSLTDERYSYLALVPLISLCLVLAERRRILPGARYSIAWGSPVLAAGILLSRLVSLSPVAADYRLTITACGAILVWIGAFVICYGVRSFQQALFPLGFLVFMIPLPAVVLDRVSFLLQAASAKTSYALFHLAGVPVVRDGFRFSLPGVEIEIAEQCSGIRSSLTLLITSVLAGHIFLRRWRSKLALILLTIPVVIFKNALRIVVISCLAVYVNRSFLFGDLHRYGGLPFSFLAVLILLPSMLLLQKLERRWQS